MIHSSSLISKKAKIGNNVKIGPFCNVGDFVKLDDDVELISNVHIEGNTIIGKGTKIFPFASIGTSPQDLKYNNEPNSLLIGESYAMSMGVNIRFVRNIMLLITSVLTGVITAFSGPIAFVGLAVPHIARLIFNTSNHTILLPASAILGAMLMLIADTFAQLPTSQYTLPINAITSLFGAPIVIWLLVRKKNLYL